MKWTTKKCVSARDDVSWTFSGGKTHRERTKTICEMDEKEQFNHVINVTLKKYKNNNFLSQKKKNQANHHYNFLPSFFSLLISGECGLSFFDSHFLWSSPAGRSQASTVGVCKKNSKDCIQKRFLWSRALFPFSRAPHAFFVVVEEEAAAAK